MLKPSGFAQSAVDIRAAVMVLLVLSADFRPAAAQPLTITASLEFSQIYRADSWQPVLIQLRNNTDQPIEGSAVLQLSHPQAAGAMRLPVSVPPHATVRTSLWGYFPPPPEHETAKPSSVAPLSVVEWRGPDGGLLARTDIRGVPISAVKSSGNTGGGDFGADRGELVLLVNHRRHEGDAYDIDTLIGH